MINPQILVIDDEAGNVEIIVEILKNENYNLLIALSGENGYEIAVNELPDLIITDWDMPGLSGIETIKLLKKNTLTEQIPVIVATGKMLKSEDLKTALEAGANDYVRKPIDKIELIARTQSVLKISEYNKLLIESKNKELAENTLHLIKNNKFNISVTKKILEIECITAENRKLIESVVDEINNKIREDSWQRFELAFESAHKDFTKNILLKYPNLTNTDLKLCIFIKLGMQTKDIAAVLCRTPDSIKVSRHRLRQKLELDSGQNLATYLSGI